MPENKEKGVNTDAKNAETEVLVNALREEYDQTNVVYFFARTLFKEAADTIETLSTQLAAAERRAKDARNELCLKCGRYHEAHNGACDGCRWKEKYKA